MSCKFSDIPLTWKVWLIDLIDSKKQKFNSRFTWNQQNIWDQFSNGFSFLPLERLAKLDAVTKQIFELIRINSETEMDDIIDILWQDVGQKYSSLYTTIENFNEALPWVNEIMSSSEWLGFIQQIQWQLHEFDNYQNRITWKHEKLQDLETRTYTLLSLIKSAIIESKWVPKTFEVPEWFEEAQAIAASLVENKELIESGIQSSKSIQTFNVNNIDDALSNVWGMFHNKDTYLPFKNPKWTWKDLYKFIKQHIWDTFFLFFDSFFSSPKWWLFFGLVPLLAMFYILWIEYSLILKWADADLKKYKEYWQILVSTHIVFVSFVGYIIVFCFWNYRKLENRMEGYKFRSILTKSFGYLIKAADDEQKKILYPKALDAIFKDLPDSSSVHQDLNINLPVTEILKSFWKV